MARGHMQETLLLDCKKSGSRYSKYRTLPSFSVLHPQREERATVFAAVPSDCRQHADVKGLCHSGLTSLCSWICARFCRSSGNSLNQIFLFGRGLFMLDLHQVAHDFFHLGGCLQYEG